MKPTPDESIPGAAVRPSARGLYATNNTPILLTRHILSGSMGFIFEVNSWHSQLMGTNGVTTTIITNLESPSEHVP